MGVPAFFRWLTEKYPKVLQDILEERVKLAAGDGSIRLPYDCTRPNPSGLECDNLYIDMNGIIHPCSHPEHGPQPTTEEEMYENVCHYVDRLFRIMRPRKLLYLAIDGVAPRAKMNQQRSRRFRSAQEARENLEVEENVRAELTNMGQKVPPLKKPWDSNVITPGTPFMLKLAEFIRFYIRKRIHTDKAWRKIRVIFSDASVPGEGEHKIMAHIRSQRSQPGYSPNLVHVLHGLDADLIMLALATHEAHFYISREEVLFGRKSQELAEQRQQESGYRDKQRQLDEEAGEVAMQLLENKQKPLCRVSIPILREYLAAEFASCITPGRIPFTPSLERLLDDIVFLCFFVGNDFLPHLPSLDIRDGALDYLINVYKRILPSLGDYITNHGGQVNLSHVDVILAEVGSIEDYVFSMKYENEQKDMERREQFNARKKQGNGRNLDAPPPVESSAPRPKAVGRSAKILEQQQEKELASKNQGLGKIKSSHMKSKDNLQAALALKQSLNGGLIKEEKIIKKSIFADLDKSEDDNMEKETSMTEESDVKMETIDEEVLDEEPKRAKRKHKDTENESGIGMVGDAEEEFDEDDDEDEELDPIKIEIAEEISPEVAAAFKERVKNEQTKKLDEYAKAVDDKVRLHEKGWKDRYYSDKCKADDVENHGGREHLFKSYIVGLCWVMKYYYEGCPSWKWYYPFHYAPFASDLRNIERFQSDVKSFELATPFKPVEQLMAVLPSDSSHAIPKAARWLMEDLESPIIDFYPKEVPVDPNGKAMPWLWVVLLPFIDEDRLLSALSPSMAKWTKEELLCNARGLDDGYLYVHESHPLAPKLQIALSNGAKSKVMKTRLIDSAAYGCPGFTGALRLPLSNELVPTGETVPAPKIPSSAVLLSHDGLFTDDIVANDSYCLAFSEPLKLSHKSILLPGAVPLPPCLNDQDRQIRRPRLNRGGGTIANLGGSSNGQNHQSGYGNMSTNTRTWGSLEPTPKRQYQSQNPFQFQARNNGFPPPPPPPPPPPAQRPPWQQQQQYRDANYGAHNQQQQQHAPYPPGPQPPYNGGRSNQMHQHPSQGYQNQRLQPNQYGGGGGHQQFNQQQQQQHRGQHAYGGPQQQQEQQRGGGQYPQQGNQQGRFDFRGHSTNGYQPPSGRGVPPQQPAAPVNSNVMNSLKAQLKSTLKQNRRPNEKH